MFQTNLKLAIGFLLVMFVATGCVVIEDGEVGVSMRFGVISEEPLGSGVALQFPVVRSVETWNIKMQERTETAQVPSSEGLIVGLDTTVQFRVIGERAPMIRREIGWDYLNILVLPVFRSTLRDVVAGFPVKRVYAEEGRKEIAANILGVLKKKLEPQGFIVTDVLLRDVKLPQGFKDSIENKLTAEQRVQQKHFELEQAVKDAEIEVARARGAAEAQKIVRSTLSDSYLQYLWIKTLNENPNVIYVATEANLPLFKNAK
jgi:regulator of protease activity HflC (stomatin/prohibitin superfamily)